VAFCYSRAELAGRWRGARGTEHLSGPGGPHSLAPAPVKVPTAARTIVCGQRNISICTRNIPGGNKRKQLAVLFRAHSDALWRSGAARRAGAQPALPSNSKRAISRSTRGGKKGTQGFPEQKCSGNINMLEHWLFAGL
jgi:hypothetical protein